jgi:hypothetical protein
LDRVPNLWEYARGTSANLATSLPPADAVVREVPVVGANPPEFSSLQAAYDSLPTSSSYRSIVRVMNGYYRAILDESVVPRKVAWIGELGHVSFGAEAVVLRGIADTDQIKLRDECVFDGFVIHGSEFNSNNRAIRAMTMSGETTEMRLVNVIIRWWNLYGSNVTVDAGAIANEGCDLWLVHVTCCNNHGYNAVQMRNLSTIENNAGSAIHLINSILWDGVGLYFGASCISGDWNAVYGSNNILQDNLSTPGNLVNTNLGDPLVSGNAYMGDPFLGEPLVISGGHLTYNSNSPARGAGKNLGSSRDINNELRPAVSPDIGADQWVDTDADNLADWWENYWFSGLSQTGAGDPDADHLFNDYEYSVGSKPVRDPFSDRMNDWDQDQLLDFWESHYWVSIFDQSTQGDPDSDGATNSEEWVRQTDPTDTQADFDGDTYNDLWEKTTFGTLDETPWTDFDDDGLPNGLEMTVILSDPADADSNNDGIPDGIAWQQGLPIVLPESGILDTDGDGVSNETEQARGSNAFQRDSDGDGASDLTDPLPLDPTVRYSWERFSLYGAPPTISLTSPPGALPL